MDSSGETLNIKTRKPYTITKQRERWTEEEHNRFLEALKLYGRAWQRIEEHIGTKTAVQIRSHAQKFFTKLEKEAVAKGVPLRQAVDIEIPPPRPKRKPSYPYPRKTRAQVSETDGKPATLVSSLHLPDLETNHLPEKTNYQEKPENTKTSEEAQIGTPTEGPQEAPCESLSSENENTVRRSNNASYITIETRKHQELDQDGIQHTNITSNISLYESSQLSHENRVQCCYPRHVPVQVVDGNHGTTAKTGVPLDMSLHESTVNHSATSGHHNDPAFHPLITPFSDNQENYRSFIHFSSTISSLIVSSLLQNPAAHAAASFAAKFWHPSNAEASCADSFPTDQTTPSMAAIAAATVAAATAWWSAHGLLPMCTPWGYPCTLGTPVDNGNQEHVANDGREGDLQEKMDAEKAELSSSEDSDGKVNDEVSPVGTKETVPIVESCKAKTNVGKQVDRSSCGSNTMSSSEMETDALEKHMMEMQETKASDANESIYRRGRNAINPNESWKEVSEEGRIAFQALFSREVLPQSFCEKDKQNIDKNRELDLNKTSQEPGESNGFGVSRGEEGGVLRMGLGSMKLNVHHTGFKPYKRCSIQAKESSKMIGSAGSQNDEQHPKRMCFETKAST